MSKGDDKQRQEKNGQTGRGEGWNAFGLVSAIGADMAICTVGGTYLGKWLDSLWGTSPWMLLLGVIVGLAAGVYGIVRLLAAFGPEAKKR
jgi:ATP synthase protein I